MHSEIYVRSAARDLPLEEFPRRLYSLFGVARFEKRLSSNYIDENYFCAIALGIEVVIAFNDTRGLEDYDFWVTLTAAQCSGFDTSYLQDHAHTLARLISQNGWRCFVPDAAFSLADQIKGTVYEF